MVYGIYLEMDQTRWIRSDYSDTNLLTGTIYSDATKETAFNLTGYTLTVMIHKRWKNTALFKKTATITTAASGTWQYAIANNELGLSAGFYLIEVELTKSGEAMSTFPVEFEVVGSPAV